MIPPLIVPIFVTIMKDNYSLHTKKISAAANAYTLTHLKSYTKKVNETWKR